MVLPSRENYTATLDQLLLELAYDMVTGVYELHQPLVSSFSVFIFGNVARHVLGF